MVNTDEIVAYVPFHKPYPTHKLVPAGDQPQIPEQVADPCQRQWAGYFEFNPGTDTADMTIEVGADDNAYVTIAQFADTPVNVNPDPVDPNGGGTYRTSSHTFGNVPAGFYYVTISYVNVGGVAVNLSQLTVTVNGASMVIGHLEDLTAGATLKTLSADEYGEISKTGTDYKGYIKSGNKLVNKHHAISVGLEYSGSYPDESFDGTPISSITTDNFEPSSVSLQKDGKARFKVWTKANTGSPSEITLNGATSDQVHYLPAVFEDMFEVTVYYTCKEENFTGDVTANVRCYVGNSNTNYVVIPYIVESFMEQVREEGFGKLSSPVVYNGESYPYLAKIDSKWRVHQHVLGSHDNVLEDKISCAVDETVIASGSRIKIMLGEQELAAFGNDTFTASDKGSSITGNHIDIYWGSDAPSHNNSSIPAGLPGGLKSGQSYRVILLSE